MKVLMIVWRYITLVRITTSRQKNNQREYLKLEYQQIVQIVIFNSIKQSRNIIHHENFDVLRKIGRRYGDDDIPSWSVGQLNIYSNCNE